MSYSRDLDEYAESELLRELQRRNDLRREGSCDYCKRHMILTKDAPCRFPNRHKGETA